jgi:hypothetical protein
MSRDQDQDFYRIGPPEDGGRDRNVGRYDERGYERNPDRDYDRGYRDYEHSDYRRPDYRQPLTNPASELSGTDWVMCILCPGIACLVGLVRTVSGNPSGGKMIGVAFVSGLIQGFLRVLLTMAAQP